LFTLFANINFRLMVGIIGFHYQGKGAQLINKCETSEKTE